MKRLAIALLVTLAACTDKHYHTETVTPDCPPNPPCEPYRVGRFVLIEEQEEGPPLVIHGWMVEDDCDESTPPVFVPDEHQPRRKGHDRKGG